MSAPTHPVPRSVAEQLSPEDRDRVDAFLNRWRAEGEVVGAIHAAPSSSRDVSDRFTANQSITSALMDLAQKIERRAQSLSDQRTLRARILVDGPGTIDVAEISMAEHVYANAGGDLEATAIALSDLLIDLVIDAAHTAVDIVRPTSADAIAGVTAATAQLAEAQRAEDLTAAEYQAQKAGAIRRLLLTVNEETNKQHTATSAEKVVNLDPEYMAYLVRKSDTVVARIVAEGALEVAKLRAKVAVNQEANA